ncbi:MAG: hypothetical protein ABI688_07420 [Bacteroidota bacterium]
MKFFFVSLLFCFSSLLGFSQQNEERIYLQTDKQCYVAGETIWFKAYLMRQFAPDDAISNLYIDLADTKGNILDEKKMPVFFGTAEGNADIGLSTVQGIYLLRIYAKIGLGASKPIVKTIYIFNPSLPGLRIAPPESFYDCRFFISNDQLTAGLINTVFFKATGIYNNPINITGYILDESQQQVLTFRDKYEGMGKLQLEPAIGKTYTARVVFPNGISKTYDLPSVNPDGLVISLEKEEKFISVTIKQKGKYEKQQLALLGIMGANLAFQHEFVMPANEYKIKIPVSDLPEGILHMIALHNKVQVGEAKTFINKADDLKIKLEKKQDSLTLVFPENTTGTFSISVTDSDKEIIPVHTNMQDELLINQEGSGSISVRNSGDVLGIETTELMVNTTSSKKIAVENLAKDDISALPDSAFLTIRGKIFDAKTKRPLSKGELILFFKGKDSSSAIFTPVISKEGFFTINNLVFYDTAVFSYKWKGKQAAEILINEERNINATTGFVPSFFADTSVFSSPQNNKKAQQIHNSFVDTFGNGKLLQAVTVTTRTGTLKEQVNNKYATGLFSSSVMARVLDLINEPPVNPGMNIFEYIQGKFADLLVTRTISGQYSLSSSRVISFSGASPEIKLYLDQTDVSADVISGIPVRDVAMIKYFPPGNARLPGIGAAGVLVVYSKKGEDIKMPDDMLFAYSFRVSGYSPIKQFEDVVQTIRPGDDLTTLYWNPRILIDASNNRYTFKLPKATTSKRIHIVAEGFTFEGNILCLDTIVQRD